MLVTTIPTALDHGMSLLHHARVDKLLFDKDRVAGLVAVALNADTRHTSGTRITGSARHYILSGGALNTPARLLRSPVPDPHGRVGQRRCIQPGHLRSVQETDERGVGQEGVRTVKTR